jgi:hypothetical protein
MNFCKWYHFTMPLFESMNRQKPPKAAKSRQKPLKTYMGCPRENEDNP